MIAIISDVHANLEALEAVLDHVSGADTICCVGDVVGYGPDPNECCELLRDRGVRAVQGNHDYTSATLNDVEPCSSMARKSFHWTHERLTGENREWLVSLPLQLDVDGMTLVHGCPGTPHEMRNTYVLDCYYSGKHYDRLVAKVRGRRLVLGHTHLPLCHGPSAKVVNPGSVGQPRDGDWRPSFCTVHDLRYSFSLVPSLKSSFSMLRDRVEFHRVEYDVEKTVAKVEAEEGLPDRLAHMLRRGGLKV
jgi:predicted phosphodiesterase